MDMSAHEEERATGMRLALDTTRELHDKVRLALASLRMKGARLPARLEPDARALEAVRGKLQQLEEQLEEAWVLPPGQLQRAAEVLCAVDETRGDVIDTCSHFCPLVDSCQPLLEEVLSFCELGCGSETAAPPAPDFGDAADPTAAPPGTAASAIATITTDASPRLAGGLTGEVTSAPVAVAAAASTQPMRRLVRDQARATDTAAGLPPAGDAAAARQRRADKGLTSADPRGATAAAVQAAAPRTAPAAAAAAFVEQRDAGPASARGTLAASQVAAHSAAPSAAAPAAAVTQQPRQRPLPLSERYARYAGVDDSDNRVLHGIDLASDTARRSKPSAADCALYGGKVSLQDYARGQAEGSDSSPRAAAPSDRPRDAKARGPSAASARQAVRRDTDRPSDVGSSRDLWVAAAQSGGASRMRVLQDAVTMSREDLERLETRGRRRSWLAAAARALAGAALMSALVAAGVVTVRTVVDEYRGGRGSCDTDDAQLEPLLPRFPPSLRPSSNHNRSSSDRSRGGLPFAPILPPPNPLDSRG